MKLILAILTLASFTFASPLCEGYGPQTPRDITDLNGTNTVVFDIYEGPGKFGGYACNNHDN